MLRKKRIGRRLPEHTTEGKPSRPGNIIMDAGAFNKLAEPKPKTKKILRIKHRDPAKEMPAFLKFEERRTGPADRRTKDIGPPKGTKERRKGILRMILGFFR